MFPEWAKIRVASILSVSLALSLRPRAQPVQNQDDLCPWGYRLHSFPAVLKHTYYLCSWHVPSNTNEYEKVSDITVRYFAKKSSLVLLCPPSVAALGVCVATPVRIPWSLHIFLWPLTLGIQTQVYGVTAEVLPALCAVSESPIANVWGRNIIT